MDVERQGVGGNNSEELKTTKRAEKTGRAKRLGWRPVCCNWLVHRRASVMSRKVGLQVDS